MPEEPRKGQTPNPRAVFGKGRRQRQAGQRPNTPQTTADAAPRTADRAARPTTQQRTTHTPERDASFLNPYTFIPVFPQSELPEPLHDARPLGHDRLHADRITGSIRVRLTVQTPLLLLDAARATADVADKEHLIYPMLCRGQRPHLPATSLKGMLRSAYEAVTGSRFGVFDTVEGPHTKPLGWRRVAKDAQKMLPVRVSDDGERLEFCTAVRLPFYGRQTPLKYRDTKQVPKHGDKSLVRCQWQGRVGTVVEIATLNDVKARNSTQFSKGYVFVTHQNAVKKGYARVFLLDNPPRTELLTPELRDRWTKVIENYRDAHTDKELYERRDAQGRIRGPEEHLGDEPGKLAWSPHLHEPNRKKLQPGTLCYALEGKHGIEGLYPVAIPRDISARTPTEMLYPELHPAPEYGLLSPADRVFGWVATEGAKTRPSSYRGRLRICNVTCTTEHNAVTEFAGTKGMPLAILGQPKPAQARFYLSEESGAPLADHPRTKARIYAAGNLGLRGRKMYWHHARVADEAGYWDERGTSGMDPTQEKVGGKGYREFRRPRKSAAGDDARFTADGSAFETTDEDQRDSQNRSVRGWVNKDTEFMFTIQVRDLSKVELGALLWLLTLQPGHHHRLGLGKPLGFGSVHLEIVEASLHCTNEWVRYYRSVSANRGPAAAAASVSEIQDAFESLVRVSEPLRTIQRAFLAVASGDSSLPVHYPRVRPLGMSGGASMPPDPRGRSYEWFTANETTDGNNMKSGHGRSLPAAVDALSQLPLYREVPKPRPR